ncbi:hypothetical protein QR680_005832 [Steinernema hermaphroditum]|uniref:RING-type domain-containing protein n=1 Tax=Steinernema hermaphroditum TaxID=289476 RepID=A0AA39LWE6_9BILA|nr:hypothetical protein QR680_005832 [Steinernema hermaphroditum]
MTTQRLNCPICLNFFDGNSTLLLLNGCGHLFHRTCIEKWMDRQAQCPTCRKEVRGRYDSLISVYASVAEDLEGSRNISLSRAEDELVLQAAKMRRLERTMKKLLWENDELKEDVSKVKALRKASMIDLRKKNAHLEIQIGVLKDEVARNEMELRETIEDNQETLKGLIRERKKAEIKTKEKQDDWRKERNRLRGEILHIIDTLKAREGEVEDKRRQSQYLENCLKAVESEKETLRKELEGVKAQLQRTKDEGEGVRRELEDTRTKIERRETLIQRLRKSVDSLGTDLCLLMQERRAALEMAMELRKETNAMRFKLEDLERS